jgi:hypothetical protein
MGFKAAQPLLGRDYALMHQEAKISNHPSSAIRVDFKTTIVNSREMSTFPGIGS